MLKDPGSEKEEGRLRQRGMHKQVPEMGENFGVLQSPVGIRECVGIREWERIYGGSGGTRV